MLASHAFPDRGAGLVDFLHHRSDQQVNSGIAPVSGAMHTVVNKIEADWAAFNLMVISPELRSTRGSFSSSGASI
jgi:hypothetical protein